MKRLSNALFLLVFLSALILIPVGTLLQKPQTVSFWENRALAKVPELTLDTLKSDDCFTRLETAYSDHVLWRDGFMRLKTWADLRLGRPVVGDQVVAGDVILNFPGYGRWGLNNLPTQSKNAADTLALLQDQITGYGGYFCYLGVPQQFSYFSDKYPSYMDNHQWSIRPTREAFAQALKERNIPYIDMLAIYDGLGRPKEYYSSVDHHYTLPGALVAYEALIGHLNANTPFSLRTYRPGDGLTLRELPNPYLGSKNRKLYDLWPTSEKAYVAEADPAIPFQRWDNGAEVSPSVYDLPQTDAETVLYSLYMGGDVAETVIRTHRPDLPSVLLVGESYTNALETVLWCSFDETRSLDLRSYTLQSLQDYIAAYRPDVVIFLRDDSSYLNPLS